MPLGVLAADLLGDRLGAEPIRELSFRTGEWALILLTATLAVTPLRRYLGWHFLSRYRRTLGLFTFSYVVIHFLVWFALDQFFALEFILEDIAKRPYITVGFTGFLLMIPLAVTSNARAVRRLGKRWAKLHALVYLIALAGIIHFTWAQKADILRPTIYAGVIVALLAARLVPKRATPPLGGSSHAASLAADRDNRRSGLDRTGGQPVRPLEHTGEPGLRGGGSA